ncbi:uncharacterized protein CTHT_0060660 [Thermochaetoides thermophila DSM 1495]|uniref:Uncharacterized protein n=1 Tax=Chaetomium thermophilum (strain DSM 1495 / CBS 144.50 / IMI 039719) TaxID=759272 RepID=G0SF35_CHATD|nr:hypothetical protein CTHT_0060660 [Thermochaetoides thermophila DSM 1495]EGS18051.1 hypothetical protein CTHT_0060660 [Thermochaetoides thermophila DSM 1495]
MIGKQANRVSQQQKQQQLQAADAGRTESMGPGRAAGEGEPSDGRQEMHLSAAHCDGDLGRGLGVTGDCRMQTGAFCCFPNPELPAREDQMGSMETGDAAASPGLGRWIELDGLSAAAAGRDLMRAPAQQAEETGRDRQKQQRPVESSTSAGKQGKRSPANVTVKWSTRHSRTRGKAHRTSGAAGATAEGHQDHGGTPLIPHRYAGREDGDGLRLELERPREKEGKALTDEVEHALPATRAVREPAAAFYLYVGRNGVDGAQSTPAALFAAVQSFKSSSAISPQPQVAVPAVTVGLKHPLPNQSK